MSTTCRGAKQLFLLGYSAAFIFQAKARMWMVHASLPHDSCSGPLQDTIPLWSQGDIHHFIAERGQSFRHRGNWFLSCSPAAVPTSFLKSSPCRCRRRSWWWGVHTGTDQWRSNVISNDSHSLSVDATTEFPLTWWPAQHWHGT